MPVFFPRRGGGERPSAGPAGAADLKASAPGAAIREGKLPNGRPGKESLAAWVKSLSL